MQMHVPAEELVVVLHILCFLLGEGVGGQSTDALAQLRKYCGDGVPFRKVVLQH